MQKTIITHDELAPASSATTSLIVPKAPISGVKPRAFIVDIDGTIADGSARQHFIAQKPKKWKEYFAELHTDTPIMPMIYVLEALLRDGYCIVLCSGRPSNYRRQTEEWLLKNRIMYDDLVMRKAGDFRPDDLIKIELYREHIEPVYEVLGVFDDRDRVVAAWRRIGLKCFQVAPGDF